MRPEPLTGPSPGLERFDYSRIGDSWAVVRLVTRLGEELRLPTAAELVIEHGAGTDRFRARACRAERRLEGEAASLLWRTVFAVPTEILEHPGGRFALHEAGAPLRSLPAPVLRALTGRRLALRPAPPPQLGRLASGQVRRRVAAVATLAALTTTSSPGLAFASASSDSSTSTDSSAGASSVTPTAAATTTATAASATTTTPVVAAAATTAPSDAATTTTAVPAPTTTTATTPAAAPTTPAAAAPTTATTPTTPAAPAAPATPAAAAATTAPATTTPTVATPRASATTSGATVPTSPATPVLTTDHRTRRLAPATLTHLSSTGHDRHRSTPPGSRCTPAGSRGVAAAAGTIRDSRHGAAATACTTATLVYAPPRHWRDPTAAEHRAAARRIATRRADTVERTTERAAKRRDAAAARRTAIMRAGIRQAQANQRKLAAAAPTTSPRSAAGGVTLLSAEPGYRGPTSWTGTVSFNPALTGVVRNLSGLLANGNRPPSFLIPIYMQAARRYHVPWEVLAAINAIESDYGHDMQTSSAGAIGWMQFEPATWREYGVAADGHSTPNPYDPRDAIFSAARYLAAAGARENVSRAVYAYNHAGWYVDEVMQRARAIAEHAQYESAQTSRAGTVSVAFATGLRHHPRVTYRGGVMSRYDRLIAAANMVSAADFPYLWGGGHEQPARFGPFDCSGSVSYVMQQAGYRLPTTVASDIGSWKLPAGPGRVTIFYSATHTFMRIGDRYFGTSGFARPSGGAGWFDVDRLPAGYLAGFHEVHLPRLGIDSFAAHPQLFRPGPTARQRVRNGERVALRRFRSERGTLIALGRSARSGSAALTRALASPLRREWR